MTAWKDKVRNGVLGYSLLSYFGKKRLQHAEKSRHVVHLDVDFHCNELTFLPTVEPTLVPTSFLGAHQAAVESA
jgi:hypothetical protein